MRSETTLYLLRHGETQFNRDGRYQGRTDSPLTPLGLDQARAVAGRLAEVLGDAPVRLLTSPLERARRTARIVADALPGDVALETDARLAEVAMGAWDGLTRAEIAQRWPDARRGKAQREWVFHGPGGETLEDVVTRLTDVHAEVTASNGGAMILVSHAMTGRILRAIHSRAPYLEALASDAPQDAIYALEPGGKVSLITTEAYVARHGS